MVWFRWLHRFIRARTRPLEIEEAFSWKNKLSLAYMLISWHCLGIVGYMCYNGKFDWAKYYGLKTEEEENKVPADYYADLLGLKKAHVIRYSGFTKKEEYDYIPAEAKNKKVEVE